MRHPWWLWSLGTYQSCHSGSFFLWCTCSRCLLTLLSCISSNILICKRFLIFWWIFCFINKIIICLLCLIQSNFRATFIFALLPILYFVTCYEIFTNPQCPENCIYFLCFTQYKTQNVSKILLQHTKLLK